MNILQAETTQPLPPALLPLHAGRSELSGPVVTETHPGSKSHSWILAPVSGLFNVLSVLSKSPSGGKTRLGVYKHARSSVRVCCSVQKQPCIKAKHRAAPARVHFILELSSTIAKKCKNVSDCFINENRVQFYQSQSHHLHLNHPAPSVVDRTT